MAQITPVTINKKRLPSDCKSDSYIGNNPDLIPFLPTDKLLINPISTGSHTGPGPDVGLSYYLNLHAEIICRSYQNGENLIFTREKKPEISVKKEPKQLETDFYQRQYNEVLAIYPNNWKTKAQELEELKRNSRELTGHAKRCIRITADKYQELILTDTWKQQKINNKAFCSFITLTYRRILPETTREAKQMLRAFFMRLQRNQGEPLYYTWVAERQTGKYINNIKTYRLENKQSVIHFHILTPYYFDKHYINRAWNEIVLNHYLKQGKISEYEAQTWAAEIETWEKYYIRLAKFKAGQTTRGPKQPPKSKFLLMPNIRAVYNAGRYMAKYMSKAGGTAGHIWGVSTKAREFLTTIEYKINHINTASATMCINEIYKLYRSANPKKYTCNFMTPIDTSGFYVFKDKNLNLFFATLIQLFHFDINGNLIYKYVIPDKQGAGQMAAHQPPGTKPEAWEVPENNKDFKFNQDLSNFFKLLKDSNINTNPNFN